MRLGSAGVNASIGGNYQITAIATLVLLIPSVGFMLFIECLG